MAEIEGFRNPLLPKTNRQRPGAPSSRGFIALRRETKTLNPPALAFALAVVVTLAFALLVCHPQDLLLFSVFNATMELIK